MDLVFEYEHAYGPLDERRVSWAKFLAGIARTARFTAREIYAAIIGPSFALSSLGSEGMSERAQVQTMLERTAFGYATPLIVGPDGRR
jgi:hypothetical protein